MVKQRFQLGIEAYKGGVRVLRVTPLDISADLKPEIAALASGVEMMLDTRDAQPGDGEIDVAISVEQAKRMFPFVAKQLDGVDKVFLFVNLK